MMLMVLAVDAGFSTWPESVKMKFVPVVPGAFAKIVVAVVVLNVARTPTLGPPIVHIMPDA
jgi:hypothetical protein